MTHFFTADWHLGHARIIKLCDRSFPDAFTMNRAIVENVNKVVGEQDHLWILGDIAWRRASLWVALDNLRTRHVHAVWGNHDSVEVRKCASRFESSGDIAEVTVNGQLIVLCHYPMRSWRRSHHGSWQLYGHHHGGLEDSGLLQMDVGVDAVGFYPLSFEQIKTRMENKSK